ncbi:PREDICTED: uncharacterized protein LOC106744513 [Dinoponera quadriceps]|uniref:Uncharacterized protein LOC106744513 n=1 Tax=Dinoponera quadriceps TaxID=609295 RepID=A0A6P3X8U7_DINQU|nr:PREDICTED: uncharacterized protein LOC106744513 [Dinoponera quadriceps]
MLVLQRKKVKDASYDDIEIDVGHNNVIINFLTVFTFLSQCLKCKKCDGDVTFSHTCDRGLGFNLVIKCKCNDQQRVSSSPLVNGAYEINRRLMFVMRILGFGLRSINTFYSLTELSSGFANAIAKERQKNAEAGNEETHLSVSGDGSWKRRGFSSLFGIATLIGKYTHKVLDFVVKSSFCQSCSNWASKKGTNKYDIWHDTHEQHFNINHIGSADKMEVDCMKEMFCRSESHGVKYATYIGDGDTKTFQALLNFHHEPALTASVQEAIPPVYEALSSDDLLQRCTGGNTQNDNESFNAYLWKLVPKHLHCGEQTIRIAAYIASGIFNEGYSSILKTM